MALAPVQLISDFMEDYPNYWLKFYEQGTTTPLVMATNKSGSPTVAKAEISAGTTPPLGLIKTAGNVTFIPYVTEAYDAYIFPTEAEADANDTSNAIQLADDVDFLQELESNLNFQRSFDTVALMVAATDLNIGDIVVTAGYTAKGDGGDNTYEIVAAATGTDDSGSFIDLATHQAQGLFPQALISALQFGADKTGVADAITILTNWVTFLGTGNFEGSIVGEREGFLPAGKYKITSTFTITQDTTVRGVYKESVIVPTFDADTAVVQQTGSTLESIVINGPNATGQCIGLDVGNAATATNTWTTKVIVAGFTTTDSVGLRYDSATYSHFFECWFTDNYHGAHIFNSGSTTTPSVGSFINCEFKSNEARGLFAQGGSNIEWINCNFELNGAQGIYLNVGASEDISLFTFENCWVEANQLDFASGGARNAEFQVLARGRSIRFNNTHFFGNTNEAKAINFNNGVDFVFDANEVFNQAGTILVDGTSRGNFVNWPESNGDYFSLVTDSSTRHANLLDTKFGEYVPGLTFATPGDLSVAYTAQKAYWTQVGQAVTLSITIITSSFTHTTASGNLTIDLGPFTTANKTDYITTGSLYFGGITKAGFSQFTPRIIANTTDIEIVASNSASAFSNVVAADMPTGGSVVLNLTIDFEVTNA